MNDTGLWLIAVLGCAVVLAVLLRRRYGNLYAKLTGAFERTTGLGWPTFLRALGILTLLAWAVVYLAFGSGEKGLGELFQGQTGGAPGATSDP